MSIAKILTSSAKAKLLLGGLVTLTSGYLLLDSISSPEFNANATGPEVSVVDTGIEQVGDQISFETSDSEMKTIESLIELEYEHKILRAAEERKKKNTTRRHDVVVF